MLKPFCSLKQLLLLLLLVISLTFSFPAYAQAEITTITVQVEPTKASGEKWDTLKGKPDLALCLSNSLVGTLCLPSGDSVTNIISAECPNSYYCRFSADVPDQNFKVSVVDVDVALNDLIGTGHCSKGKTCEVGQATVSVSKEKGFFKL
jgi:hypothetical protein